MAGRKDSDKAVWALSSLTAFSGIALLVFGSMRPVPLKNLADPLPPQQKMPVAVYNAEPSAARKIANKKNKDWAKHCSGRKHDCEIACGHYEKASEEARDCFGYCEKTEKSCLGWANN